MSLKRESSLYKTLKRKSAPVPKTPCGQTEMLLDFSRTSRGEMMLHSHHCRIHRGISEPLISSACRSCSGSSRPREGRSGCRSVLSAGLRNFHTALFPTSVSRTSRTLRSGDRMRQAQDLNPRLTTSNAYVLSTENPSGLPIIWGRGSYVLSLALRVSTLISASISTPAQTAFPHHLRNAP